MRDLMVMSHLALSAGGQTLVEMARCGLPSVSVAVSDNQVAHAEGFAKCGTTVCAGYVSDPALLRTIGDALERCNSVEVRSTMSSRGPKLIDGSGPRRIAAAVMAHFS